MLNLSLSSYFTDNVNNEAVRCSTCNLRGIITILDLPKVKSTTFDLRSWRYAASKLWSTILDEPRNIQTYTTFKNNLKTLNLTGF